MIFPASIPSPPQNVWHLGPLPIRAYALCIMVGIVVTLIWGSRRYRARGGNPDDMFDAAIAAIPAGIIGGRIYHVVTSYQYYFGPGRNPWDALKIWEGGMGIIGAVMLGALAIWLVLRRRGLRLAPLADALAPAVIVAQAIGRNGNWFNQELFGGPTTLPWGLQIDAAHLPAGYAPGTLFHPTFLYEMIWNLAVAAVLVWWDKGHARAGGVIFWLYVAGYGLGRCWIEMVRIDEANHILGLRINVWAALILIILGLTMARWCTLRGYSTEVDLAAGECDSEPMSVESKHASSENRVHDRSGNRESQSAAIAGGRGDGCSQDQPVPRHPGGTPADH